MGNAIWLFVALPLWFFSTLSNPFVAGVLSAIPFAGIVCLAVGAVIGVAKRQRQLLWFFASVALSQGYVAVAGLFRRMLKGDAGNTVFLLWNALSLLFLGLQLATIISIVYRSKDARAAAILLALFCVTYALFAGFIAGMSVSDTWL